MDYSASVEITSEEMRELEEKIRQENEAFMRVFNVLMYNGQETRQRLAQEVLTNAGLEKPTTPTSGS